MDMMRLTVLGKEERTYDWGTRFLAIAAAEAIVGWTGVAGTATAISWLLCVLFLSVALVSVRGATWRGLGRPLAAHADSSVAGWHGDEAVGSDSNLRGKR
jgi:uncharacterized membrane protein YtjA (UPF0391 family)